MTDIDVAREAVALFEAMNRDWWAGPTEAFIYNEFADALREGFRLGILRSDDLLTEDDLVLAKLDSADRPTIARAARPDPTFPPRIGRGICPSRRAQGTLDRPDGAGGWIRRTAIDARRSGFPT